MNTIQTWLDGVGLKQPINECPAWPPDLYALAGTLLQRSGAYLRVFERQASTSYLDGIEDVASAWRKRIDEIDTETLTVSDLRSALVDDVVDAWAKLIAAGSTPVSELRSSNDLAELLIRLILIADEASVGIGTRLDREIGAVQWSSNFLSIADSLLCANQLQSFCQDVPPGVICVIGKQHTPQKGATFRALSHHLALYHPDEIEARWVNPVLETAGPRPPPETLNLLLLPWPTEVATEDFQGFPPTRADHPGYFRFEPKNNESTDEFSRRLLDALETAKRQAGTIDAIVFPELALTKEQYDAAEELAVRFRTILIGGLRQASASPDHWDANLSVLQAAGSIASPDVDDGMADFFRENLRFFQAKHHRWYLDREQIISYQLGARLPASRGCWEHIEIPPRVLHFVTLNSITWSVLICEDLARQDPAAHLIRAVGPNILVVLLNDGPQLSGRWPSRYASVLADDPGTSVLTLTSLGMAERSRPVINSSGQRAEPSNVIALWRDAVAGEIQIAPDAGHDACILSLECRRMTEYRADGRSEGGNACYPTFAGFRSFKTAARSQNGGAASSGPYG